MIRTGSIHPETFFEAIHYVPKTLPFIDLGCGKGRGLILAHQAGFRTLIGVEFSPALAETAQRNIAIANVWAEIVVQDAINFPFPGDEHVSFMYNPFGASVMRAIAPKLNWVVYINPAHKSELKYMEVIHETDGYLVLLKRPAH